MALIKWEPLNEVEQVRRQMDRMFSQMLGGMWPGTNGHGMPPVEIYRTDKELVVNVELPGCDPKDVNVEITEDSVRVSGEIHRDQEIKDDHYYRSERAIGKFQRLIALPDPIKEGEAKATFKHGLLTLRAPFAQAQRPTTPRKIAIQP